jgi:hypothetical protein
MSGMWSDHFAGKTDVTKYPRQNTVSIIRLASTGLWGGATAMAQSDRGGIVGFGDVAAFAAILLFTSFFVWIVAESKTHNDSYATRYARQHSENAERQIVRTCIDADKSALAKCITDIVKTQLEEQRAEYNLSAQQETANWSLGMLGISALSLFIAGFGIFFVRENLLEMRKQREISQNSLKALTDQNALGNPPRLRVTYFSINPSGSEHTAVPTLKANEKIQGHVWLTNDGADTAVIKQAHCAFAWLTGDHFPMVSPISMLPAESHIKPRKYRPSGKDFIDNVEFATGESGKWVLETEVPRWRLKKGRLYILGYVYFCDSLGRMRYITFARVYSPRRRQFTRFADAGDHDIN